MQNTKSQCLPVVKIIFRHWVNWLSRLNFWAPKAYKVYNQRFETLSTWIPQVLYKRIGFFANFYLSGVGAFEQNSQIIGWKLFITYYHNYKLRLIPYSLDNLYARATNPPKVEQLLGDSTMVWIYTFENSFTQVYFSEYHLYLNQNISRTLNLYIRAGLYIQKSVVEKLTCWCADTKQTRRVVYVRACKPCNKVRCRRFMIPANYLQEMERNQGRKGRKLTMIKAYTLVLGLHHRR